MDKRYKLLLFLIFSTAIATTFYLFKKFSPAHRPYYLLINETENHDHDLALRMSLKLAERRSGIENALILLKRLPETKTIEEVAAELFKKYEIGRTRNGNGVLYLYSEKENQMKIEVSYSLEAIFPDVFCRKMSEAAKTYMLSDVPQDFLSELLITMNIRAQEKNSKEEGNFDRPAWFTEDFLSGGGGARSQGYRKSVVDLQNAIQKLSNSQLREFQPSSRPSETVERYLKSVEMGFGDPGLMLLTEGSQIFRAITPRNSAQQQRVFEYYMKAFPYQMTFEGNLGLVIFKTGVPNLPIVLRKGSDGLWYVDESKAWTYFHRWENENDFVPKFDDLPLWHAYEKTGHPGLKRVAYRGRVKTPMPPAYPFHLVRAVGELESQIQRDPRNDRYYAELGELYFFEMNWVTRALESFEKASALAPDRLDYRWRLVDLYIQTSRAGKFIEELRYLSEKQPEDLKLKELYLGYKREYEFR